MNPQKNKGDKAEREAAILLSKLLGIRIDRRFGAGQKLDTGDLEGIPNTVVQVCDLANKNDAVLRKPREAEIQRKNAGVDHAITMVRFKKIKGQEEGDNWRVVLTLEQYAKLIK
tara:strand:- start:319 stop:660 length:342 start_codon:yes stop_codon:yes gene_type:complete